MRLRRKRFISAPPRLCANHYNPVSKPDRRRFTRRREGARKLRPRIARASSQTGSRLRAFAWT